MKAFDLMGAPIDYIVSVHVTNMILTPDIEDETIMGHLHDLSLTYGQMQVELTVKDLFPRFYNKQYLSKVG